jgi:hypothetical protein
MELLKFIENAKIELLFIVDIKNFVFASSSKQYSLLKSKNIERESLSKQVLTKKQAKSLRKKHSKNLVNSPFKKTGLIDLNQPYVYHKISN